MNNDSFLILFLILMALMTLIPLCLRRFKIPVIISLMIVGMVIGENAFNLLGRIAPIFQFIGGNPEKTVSHAMTFINSLGSLGLLFLMTLAGMEADFKLLKNNRKTIIMLSILTFLLPAISGYFVYRYFRAEDLPGKLLYASLFASHSVGIVFPIIRELNLTKSVFGAAILISTIVTDISSIVLLAVSVQMKKMVASAAMQGPKTLSLLDYLDPGIFGNYFIWFFLAVVAVYFILVLLIVPRLGELILKLLDHSEDAVITCFIFLVMLTVLLGEFLGINLVVGAFLAGLALSRVVKAGSEIFRKFEGIGYGFLIPFLFLSIGMKTDLRVAFTSFNNIQIIVLTIVGLVGSKVFSGWLALRLCGYSNVEGLTAGVMTVPQLSATLAAAAIGRDLGMLDNNFFNAIILLSLVTTLPVPNIVRSLIEHHRDRFLSLRRMDVEPFQIEKKQEDVL